MLRISKLADYGTVVMVDIAHHAPAIRNAKEIAESVHLAHPTVSKCLKLLTTAGLLISQMGAKGGYALARDPARISVAEIIRAVEGTEGLTECTYHAGLCDLESVCSIRHNWRVLSQAIYGALEKVSLMDLMQPQLNVHTVNVRDITGLHSHRQSHE